MSVDGGAKATSPPAVRPPRDEHESAPFWVPAGGIATVAGREINGGLIFVGKGLRGGNGWGEEASLIDPSLPVNRAATDLTVRELDYWPTYTAASRDARGKYLSWLASGRSHPGADIGFVFLYFYGLERRALVDAVSSDTARAELPAILREVERLLSIYGENPSFQRYAASFLDFLRAGEDRLTCPDVPPPAPELPYGGLPFTHRYCLAQFSLSRRPLPAEWAFAWLVRDPTTRLRTSAQRCPDEFKRAFLDRYGKSFGGGMLLPQNKTRLKAAYQPASPSLRGSKHLEKSFDLPDVTVLSSPMKKLQAIAAECMDGLDAYSRFLGRNPEKAGSADALVELPFNLWPEAARKPIEQIKATIQAAGKPLATKFEKVQGLFPDWHDANRQRYLSLARALSEVGMGIEPDIRFGGKLPSAEETVVLFADELAHTFSGPTAEYGAAALTLHLAAAVSGADGNVDEPERQLLLKQLENWMHLPASARRRLQAHLRLLLTAPPSLTSLKKRIEVLSLPERKAIGEFLALVAKADNDVTAAEVKMLEKVFKMLGLEVQTVYGLLHVAAEAPVTVRPSAGEETGFAIPRPPKPKDPGIGLDMGRVAALHAESEKVSALLGAIFAEEVPAPEPAPSLEPQETEAPDSDGVLGLDAEHSALARLLWTRLHWAREELEELAQDRGILLDGALERINEAAFDNHDQPFCEGDDPVEINQELLKEISP